MPSPVSGSRADRTPLHLVLGTDALDRTRAVLRRWETDLNRWESTSRGTDFVTRAEVP